MLSLFESKRGREYEEEEEEGGGQERLIKLKGEQCLAAKETRLTTRIAATRWESSGTSIKCSTTMPTITIRADCDCNCNCNLHIRSSSTTMEMKRLYQQQQQTLFAKASSSIAIILLIILSHAIQQGERCVLAQARLIRIYQNNNHNHHNQHHHAPESTSSFNQDGGGGGAGTNSTPEQDDRQEVLDRHRRATINFGSSSPVQRIIDLIGSHAPVIVVDSTGGESGEQQTTPGVHQAQSASATGQNVQLGPAGGGGALQLEGAAHSQAVAQAHFGQPAHQLQTQQQQQHWTIVDTSQMLQQQQQQPQQPQQQQQQQPMAQQQQLMQTSVPNEQYFSFTPFGLAQTGNPFASLQPHQYQQQYNPYMMNLQQQQQQQPQQQPIGQHLLQSSQNLQQQQVATTGAVSQQSEPVQPVFLSSYVPELPIAGQTGGPGLMQQFANSAQGQFTGPLQQQQPQQLQPNSIQQIQQAQQQQQQLSAGQGKESEGQSQLGKSDDSGDSDNDSNRDDEGQAAAAGPARDEQTDDSGEPPDSSDQDSDMDNPTARSGSASYEDKYDSDDQDGDQGGRGGGGSESQIRRLHKAEARSQPPGPLAATKKGSHMINSNNSSSGGSGGGGNGLINVGLNDDCMQCICRATSGCDLLLRCITIGAEEKYCGPFKLSEEYWHKAGSPGDSANNFDSFEECANDADCAAETVSNYMKKYYRDCDGDELVTCIDYARLHKLKPDECNNSQKLHRDFGEYWQSFEGCAEGYNRAQNGDDEDI